ncbi:MAG: sulfur carrier protein ThiS [Bacteroidales bacterium]|nr:sulfur carrier protein ThiS [Bacteroidales bacterium]
MKIILNNRQEEFNYNTISISKLLEIKKFTFKMLVIKINGNLIKKEARETTYIQDGDNVIVLHLISGG